MVQVSYRKLTLNEVDWIQCFTEMNLWYALKALKLKNTLYTKINVGVFVSYLTIKWYRLLMWYFLVNLQKVYSFLEVGKVLLAWQPCTVESLQCFTWWKINNKFKQLLHLMMLSFIFDIGKIYKDFYFNLKSNIKCTC